MEIKELFKKIGNWSAICFIGCDKWIIEPKATMRRTAFEYIQQTTGIKVFVLDTDAFENPTEYLIKVI